MSYFHVLQVTSKHQINSKSRMIHIDIPKNRFLEYTAEDIRLLYKVPTEDKLNFLKKYPAVVTVEQFVGDVVLVKIAEISYQENSLNVNVLCEKLSHYSFDPDSDESYKGDEGSKEYYRRVSDEREELKKILDFEGLEEFRNHWAIKSGDFFEKVNNSFLSDFYNFKEIFLEYKNHFPITPSIGADFMGASSVITGGKLNDLYVNSVSGFIDKIIEFNNNIEMKSREVFYRGHSNAKEYFLQPSLFRQYKSKGPIYLKSEHSSFRELLTTEPRYFSTDTTCFDILTRMQHYSLPTRLLDISSNPLAALYFACLGRKEVEGEVILLSIKKEAINYFDSDKVTCLTNLAKLKEIQKEDLSKLIQKCEEKTALNSQLDEKYFNESTSYAQYIHFIRQEKPYFEPKILTTDLRSVICVKGRLNQDRIIAQAGSFLIFGLDAFLPEEGTEIIKISRIRIASTNKKRMIEELDLLGVNSRTIYPSMENTSKYIKAKLEGGD